MHGEKSPFKITKHKLYVTMPHLSFNFSICSTVADLLTPVCHEANIPGGGNFVQKTC
jgi:hypothetical protein